MYPEDEQITKQLGESAARLLVEVDTWIIRRKESVEVLDDSVVRRHMSVDFDLPSWVKSVHEARDGKSVYYAPLFMLQKGSDDIPLPTNVMVEPPPHFAGFDLRDPRGESMSLPPRVWNATVSIQTLRAAFREAGLRHGVSIGPPLWPFIDELLEHICRSERNEAVGMLEELKRGPLDGMAAQYVWIRALIALDKTLDWLLEACAKSSVAMVPLIGDAARQGVVKLSYTEQIARFGVPLDFKTVRDSQKRRALFRQVGALAGSARYEFWIDTPFIGSQNYHIEVSAPEGLEIYDAGLIEVSEDPPPETAVDGGNIGTLARVSGLARERHLYWPGAGAQHGALTWVRMRVERQEVLTVAAVVSFLIAAILWISHGTAKGIMSSPRGVPELLLLFPGAVATYVVRPGSHRLTGRLVRIVRGVLVLVSLTPYVAAASLALAKHDKDGRITSDSFIPWLWWLAIIATVGAAFLLVARFTPQPLIRRQRIGERLLGWEIR
jgi:hypothetical protein